MERASLVKWVDELQAQIDQVKRGLKAAAANVKSEKSYIGRTSFIKSGINIVGFEIDVAGEFASSGKNYQSDFTLTYDLSEDEYYSVCGAVCDSGSNYFPIYHYVRELGQDAVVTEYAIAEVTMNTFSNKVTLTIRSMGDNFGADSGGNPPNVRFSVRELEAVYLPEPTTSKKKK